MEALSHNNIHDFLATAGDFLNADPVNHSVHLTGMDAALRGERAAITLISLHDNGTVVGAATQIENRPLHVAAMPVAAAPLVANALRGREINEVTGTRDGVEAFRKLWREGGTETYALRLYRLEELAVPDVPGEPRLATPADDDLITDWWIAFAAELDGLTHAEAEQRAMGSRGMSAGHVLWLVDGKPVSWAGSTTPVGGVSR
ncbi:hypothetical protein AB0G82_38520, partial [Streptomyces anulatus]|uniref:hypothetical protein n=1 Tax=Streptomyces anulatus TaxID=1892 RepID=UPI0033CB5459